MSIKLTKGFCGNLSAAAILAASISLSALSAVQAQSMDTSSSSSTTAVSSTSSTASATTDNADGSSTTTSTTSTTVAPKSDTQGVLWTDPKYAVKEVPAKVALPSSANRPTTGTTTVKTTTVAPPSDLSYDEKSAQAFSDSVGMPQYVWTKQDIPSKGQKAAALNASKEMAAYNRKIVEKFVANMTVPNSATLVENSSSQYLYLISFVIDSKGNIKNINSEKSYGSFNAFNLADETENSTMTASVVSALKKCSPLALPPAGVPPWYMLLKYEPNTGKVFVAHLNTI